MNANAIKDLPLRVVYTQSFEILEYLQFERIFKYHDSCKFLIAWAFLRLLSHYMTEKITRAFICTAVQIKN